MRTHVRSVSNLAVLFATMLVGAWFASAGSLTANGWATGGDGPAVPQPPDKLVATFPLDPNFMEAGNENLDRPFFNDFSWRAFIAVNWPADAERRGVPHPTNAFGDVSGPVVWGTWKSLDELFPADPIQHGPTEWDSYEATLAIRWLDREQKQRQFPLKDLLSPQDARKYTLLHQFTRLSQFNEPGFPGIPSGPLVAQNGTLVRFEARVNQKAYDFVRDNKYFIKKNLPNADGMGAPANFPEGSVNVKAAWMELPEDEGVRNRFYQVRAKVVDWAMDGTPILNDRTMGLVGLHIVVKTPKREDWIWSTFEHVDNLAPASGGRPASFSSKIPPLPFVGNGPKPPVGSFVVGEPLPKAAPVEVVRKEAIDPATEEVNRRYHDHPQVKGTVWENYKLVGTQWPKLNLPTRLNPANRLPKDLANVTLETYFQTSSCLRCHANAMRSGFVFYPELRAFDPGPAGGAGP